MGATYKQIRYIEYLLKSRDWEDEWFDDFRIKTVLCGLGDNLSRRQASQLIDDLLSTPEKSRA